MNIANYLNSLLSAYENLKTILINKGVTVSESDKLNTLVDKVEEISGTNEPIEKVLYSFGVLSDIHLKDSSFGNDETESVTDYQRALTYYKNNNVDLVAVVGDIVANNHLSTSDTDALIEAQNEWVSELNMFASANAMYLPNKPVYTCVGNHDATPHGFYVAYNANNADTEGLNIPVIADGYDGTKTAETVWKEIIGMDIHHVVKHNDDVFIFFSMYYWYYAKFCRDSDIEWLEAKLEEYKDRRVFLFFHVPLKNTFNFTDNTSVFDDAPAGHQSNVRMGNLVRKYKNVIWFSGHTHYDLALEETYDNPNTYQSGDSSTMIHCASGTYTRLPNGDSYINVDEGSQGYLVDVYENKIVIKGIDFTVGDGGAFIPSVNYVINT